MLSEPSTGVSAVISDAHANYTKNACFYARHRTFIFSDNTCGVFATKILLNTENKIQPSAAQNRHFTG